MTIAKFFAGAALVAAPFSLASAQGSTPADSSNGGHHMGWMAGTAAAAGAGVFMAFTHSGHGAAANSSHYSVPTIGTTPSAPTTPGNGLAPSPAGGSTPPANTPVAPDTASDTTPPPADNPPSFTNDTPTYQDGPAGPVDDSPAGPTDDPPHVDAPQFAQPFAQESSTVPEPGTLALTATGILGLAPLIRRRRR